MKILIIQLARLGDIYQSWPVVRAVQRQNPQAEIHLLVRKRFAAAADAFRGPIKVRELETQHLLEPLVQAQPRLEQAAENFTAFVDELAAEKFDRVINLSFSPFSSYLAELVAGPETDVRGYTRFPDGYLAIPDDPSAYFYAQVGVARFNRAHLTEILAAVAGVDLEAVDRSLPKPYLETIMASATPARHGLENEQFLLLHIGASQSGKTYSAQKWQRVVSRLRHQCPLRLVIAGAVNEKALAVEICAGFTQDKVLNLVGETSLTDLFALLHKARLVIGGDSLLMQMASLTQTPCLNISFASVNFWETGPRVAGSRIVWAPTPEDLASDRVTGEVLAMLAQEPSGFPVIEVNGAEVESLNLKGYQPDDFGWDLVRALYMGQDFPLNDDSLTALGMQRLNEICVLAMDYLPRLLDPSERPVAVEILSQVDAMIPQVEKMVPRLQPLTAWFCTERLRWGPASVTELVAKNQELFDKLQRITALYLPPPQVVSMESELGR